MAQWEYTYVRGAEGELDRLIEEMNQLGDAGWEAFSSHAIKKQIAADSVAILFKRAKGD
jgi:hypothetical protein